MGSFFNTLRFDGADLERENARAAKQEELVLAIFKANPGREISPSQLHFIFGKKYHLNPPLTSIRRCLTNLTGRMELNKTDTMVQGSYHLKEHCWKLSQSSTVTKAPIHIQQGLPQTQGSLFDL